MISSEVQRTLVKSPPELWAEISDPQALARHLGEFGEIRITRVQPEQKVEWEADDASGSIVIKPSGWGTKVKLSVTRELDEARELGEARELEVARAAVELDEAAGTPEAKGEAEAEGGAEAEASAAETAAVRPAATEQPGPGILSEAAAGATDLDEAGELLRDELEGDSLEPAGEHELQPEHEPQRRRGFFARLFGRRRAARLAEAAADADAAADDDDDDGSWTPVAATDAATSEHYEHAREAQPDDEVRDERDILAPEISGADASDATLAAGEEPTLEPAAKLEQAEEAAAEQVTAVLTGVLDRLGAAHHRPFSRA
jgi:hypothetical protein